MSVLKNECQVWHRVSPCGLKNIIIYINHSLLFSFAPRKQKYKGRGYKVEFFYVKLIGKKS